VPIVSACSAILVIIGLRNVSDQTAISSEAVRGWCVLGLVYSLHGDLGAGIGIGSPGTRHYDDTIADAQRPVLVRG